MNLKSKVRVKEFDYVGTITAKYIDDETNITFYEVLFIYGNVETYTGDQLELI